VKIQVNFFWVVMPCSVIPRTIVSEVHAASIFILPQHRTQLGGTPSITNSASDCSHVT